jgi:hypothetical protein
MQQVRAQAGFFARSFVLMLSTAEMSGRELTGNFSLWLGRNEWQRAHRQHFAAAWWK